MKKVIGIVALMFIAAVTISSAKADIKYNMFTNEWERAAEDSELKYNAFNNEWSFERENSFIIRSSSFLGIVSNVKLAGSVILPSLTVVILVRPRLISE